MAETHPQRFTPEQLRKRSTAVYLACDEAVAADLSACLRQAADDAEALDRMALYIDTERDLGMRDFRRIRSKL